MRRALRPEQNHNLTAVPDRLVGEHPDAGHAQAPGDKQQVAAARVHLIGAPKRPEHVQPIALPGASQPLRAAADRPEVERDDARSRVGGVYRERPPQDEA